ncbi:MAG: HIT family protein [Patescibacteria group bacterium]|jgi:histidine triad (HIT) family protein
MCIFCQIIKDEIPARKFYEDDSSLAFLDIAPVVLGHSLVVPKNHYSNIYDIPEGELKNLMVVVKMIVQKLKDKLGVSACNVIQNNGRIAGQVIEHLHFHIIPREENDGLELWPHGDYSQKEVENVLAKLLS